MTKELKLHKIQTDILVNLLLNPTVRFSDLTRKNIQTDKLNFHVKRLVADGLVKKGPDGEYFLTVSGKEFANRFDTTHKVIEKQAKISVRVVCIRTNDQGKSEYLLEKRLKQPYWGFWGLPGGKIGWGEEVLESAKRELYEETGLTGSPELVAIKHKMDYNHDGTLLEDKFFFVCRVLNPRGKLKVNHEGGQNKWVSADKVFNLEKLFDGIADSINAANKNQLKFLEKKYEVKGY